MTPDADALLDDDKLIVFGTPKQIDEMAEIKG